jgi:hypothetical protein
MNCVEFEELIDDCLADTLTPPQRDAVLAHTHTCASCSAALKNARMLRAETATLPREVFPARDLWPQLEARLARLETEGAGRQGGEVVSFSRALPLKRPIFVRLGIPLAAAAAAIAVAVAFFWPRAREKNPAAWTIAALSGELRVGDEMFTGSANWHVGEWLETDAATRARLDVGTIGEVRLEPNSRLRLLESAPNDHRIELARGTMHALIWAPPRLFFVETPSATAIDLGCAYTLTVSDEGASTLKVTSGYVALDHGGRETLIPAGMMCVTRPDLGPGTPFASDASPALRDALQRFDFETHGDGAADAAIADVLAHVGRGDAITLWHLLSRATPAQRGPVFDKLAAFASPPSGITRAGIVAGDPSMLDRWARDLGLAPLAR